MRADREEADVPDRDLYAFYIRRAESQVTFLRLPGAAIVPAAPDVAHPDLSTSFQVYRELFRLPEEELLNETVDGCIWDLKKVGSIAGLLWQRYTSASSVAYDVT